MAEKFIAHDEAVEMVGKNEDEFKSLVRDKGLRIFRDGALVKYLRNDIRELAGLEPEEEGESQAGEPESQEEEEFDFLTIVEEEDGDTASDTLELQEDAEPETQAEVSAEEEEELTGGLLEMSDSTAGDTSETVEAAPDESAEEIEMDEGELWAPVTEEEDEESTGQVPTAPLLEDLAEADEESTGEVKTAAVLEEVEAAEGEGAAEMAAEEEGPSLGTALADVEEEGEEIAAPKVRKTARRVSAGASDTIWWIMLIIATVFAVASAGMIVDQYVGPDSVQGIFRGILEQIQGMIST